MRCHAARPGGPVHRAGDSRGTSSLAWLSSSSIWFGFWHVQDLLPALSPPDPPQFSSYRKKKPFGFYTEQDKPAHIRAGQGKMLSNRRRAGSTAVVTKRPVTELRAK